MRCSLEFVTKISKRCVRHGQFEPDAEYCAIDKKVLIKLLSKRFDFYSFKSSLVEYSIQINEI